MSFSMGDRVDTPFGLGIVRSVRDYEDLRGGPYVHVVLDNKNLTHDGTALLAPEDVKRVHRPMFDTRMSCGHLLVQYGDLADGEGAQRCPICGQDVVIEREAPAD